ncbi:MAG TPA: hypothetical protein VGF76_07430 [Polyangiaceae bacterium]
MVAACGGRASDGDRVAGSAGAAPSIESAGAPAEAGADAGRTGEAGAESGCRGKLADLKTVDVACPAELCTGTVSLSLLVGAQV